MKKALVLSAVLLLCLIGPACAETLALPSAVTIIDEEAFFGDTSLDIVVLPDGVLEIRAKAFADSSLTYINLPPALTFIADDALPPPGTIEVTAVEGTMAYDWAAAHGYIEESTEPPDIPIINGKMPTGFFVRELVAALNRGDGYIMGAYGQNPRTGYLDLDETNVQSAWREDGWFYTQYSGSQLRQALKWRSQCTRVWDCAGLAEGIYEIYSGISINTQSMYIYSNWCSVKGKGMIPANKRVPGAAVFWASDDSKPSSIHHVAYLWKPVQDGHPEGDWYFIEARGVMYGVVKGKLLSRNPNYWGYMDKYYDYSDSPSYGGGSGTAEPHVLGSRVLKRGSKGTDVQQMQNGLIRLGYDLGSWGADGDFGEQTEIAVRQFQADHGLSVSGQFDSATFAAYKAALAALEGSEENPGQVIIEGGNCYIRDDCNTDGAILGVAYEGDTFTWAGEIADNGWLRIVYGEGTAWVSGKYGRLTG